jgi:GNAT superfamily N-acetyltransferase
LHQTSLTKYANYIKEKANIELIEHDYGFVSYSLLSDHVYIHDMYIDKDHRRKGIGSDLLKQIEIIAWAKKIKYVLSAVQINSNGLHEALLAQMLKGFKIVGADEKEIKLAKEIIWEAQER